MDISDIIEMISRHDQSIRNLEECLKAQNGSLKRVEQRVEQIYFWLIGLMGGVIASLILLVVNLAIKR